MKTLVILFLTAPLFAQTNQPNLVNAQVASQPYSGNLKGQIVSSTPAWSGYAIKTKRGDHQSCCWNDGRQQGCSLEGGKPDLKSSLPKSPIPLEGTDTVAVLFRSDAGAVSKVRIFSLDCPLDGGGLPFRWIEGVPAAESLAFLDNLIHGAASDQVMDGSVLAVAQHDTSAADVLFERLTQSSEREKIREKSIFWLGAARGTKGIGTLEHILKTDSSEHIRDKAIFALSMTKKPEALNAIVEAAKNDSSTRVRGQALFWLAQAAGDRAASTIMNAIENDPDTQVKEKAVFALSQLPKEEGVPKLIQVATEQRNPEVKKKAFFWLGQSQDPRALAFITKTLGN